MNDMDAFDRQLARVVLRRVGPSEPVDDLAIYTGIVAANRSSKWRFESMFSATRFAVAGIVVALLGGLLLIAQPFDRVTVPGAERDGLPPVTGPAGNGLIAFEHDGDIYVGDPVTGESEAIVAGPEMDHHPRFSPDGTQIAFMRVARSADTEDLATDADIVVVRADGSDERVVTLERPFGREIFGFEWTPDSRSLVSHPDIPVPVPGPRVGDYLLDAAAVAEPVRLPYTTYGKSGSLRPPEGDRVLGCPAEPMMKGSLLSCLLADMDRDGTDIVDLGAASGLDEMGYDSVYNPTWSPDASQILFEASTPDPGHTHHLLVMDADGSDLRLLKDLGGEGGEFAWSPDGSRVAFQRAACCEDRALDPAEDVIVVLDVETGIERILEATTSPFVSTPDARYGPFKGWAWSPDGQSILYAPTSSNRLFTVDVASGEATELPWVAGRFPETIWSAMSTPSWQRVAAD